jgi:hypothetical protein
VHAPCVHGARALFECTIALHMLHMYMYMCTRLARVHPPSTHVH